MAYKKEYKQEILEQMKTKKLDAIVRETGISISTLYNWKNEKNREEIRNKSFGKEIAKPIKANMERKQEDDIEKLEILAKTNPLNKHMQTRLMKMYVEGGKEKEAIEFAKAEANLQNEDIQTQLMKMYIEREKEEEAIEFAKANLQNEQIQTQLMKMYIERENEYFKKATRLAIANQQNAQIQKKLMDLYKRRNEQKETEIIGENEEQKAFEQIKEYRKSGSEEDKEKAEELAKRFPKSGKIQIQLMKMYVESGREEEAIEFAKANSRNGKIQTQLMEMYVEKGKEEEAIELAKANKQNAQIQKQLIALYRRRKGQTIQLVEPNAEKEEAQQEINEEQEEIEDNDNQDNIASVVVEELSNEEKREEIVVEEHIANEDIVDNSTHTSKKKTNNNAKKAKSIKVSRKDTIENSLSKALKETISKINCYYYVHMQPSIQGSYEESKRQEKYIKKYDKLQSILGCDTNNKRAQMELMLVLINEGYREVVKREFSEKDYEFVDEIIKGYYTKTIKPQDAKKEIDEYCM